MVWEGAKPLHKDGTKPSQKIYGSLSLKMAYSSAFLCKMRETAESKTGKPSKLAWYSSLRVHPHWLRLCSINLLTYLHYV